MVAVREWVYPSKELYMFVPEVVQPITPKDRRMAWMIAIGADAIQIVALPFFAEGGISPFDTFVDLAAAFALTRLLGWHWAFLPAVIAELIPGLDLFPTWTAAVFYVMRQRARSESAVTVQAEPPSAPRSLNS